MALYEHMLIARQDISAQAVDALATHLKTIVETEGGKVEKQEYWGLRTLAFRIKKNRKGHYVLLNLNAPVHFITHLMDRLKARPEAMIVNTTSGLAIAPRAGGPIYCATKAALRSYTLALREQLKRTNIHVLEVLPPVVETKMTAGRGSKKMSPQECAAQMVRAMESNAKEANVGMVKILRAVYSISPALARRIMIGF